MSNSRERVKAHIAERTFAMLKVLAKIAYQGHTATSVSGGVAVATTLHTQAGCAKVHANGDLDMDSRLTDCKEFWSHLETLGNANTNVDAKPNSVAGLLWIWFRVLILYKVGKLKLSQHEGSMAKSCVEVVVHFLEGGMSKWAVNVEEPTSAVMLSLQKQGWKGSAGDLEHVNGRGQQEEDS